MNKRGSGILLHLTSLPSAYGIGDMGPRARQFVDFLSTARQSYWQILPLNPTELLHGNSPYHCSSAFACNPLLISPELLVKEGLLTNSSLEPLPEFSGERIDYSSVVAYRSRLFHRAFERFKGENHRDDYDQFCSENAYWLDDFSLFVALKSHFKGKDWSEWPEELRERQPETLRSAQETFHEAVEKQKFLQFTIFSQWSALKRYCNGKGIRIIGDMPIYVVHDSADLWVNPELFKLDHDKKPETVAGVPPDYFSDTGQLWGNPVFRWNVHKDRDYDWWIQRIAFNLRLFDFLRIDHFRGFLAYWEVPATEKNAINGRWVEAPAMDFFHYVTEEFSNLPIIAEDLGTITPDVRELMEHFEFPGMKVLLFAFGHDLPGNPYIPHNHIKNCVVYTGTHDNNTIKGWFEKELSHEDRERLFHYLGREVSGDEINWELIRMAMMSVANTVIFPLQDLLGLGEQARMNLPATRSGNWEWRFVPDQLTTSLSKRLREMTEIYGRV